MLVISVPELNSYTFTVTVSTDRPLSAGYIRQDLTSTLRGNPVTSAYNPVVTEVADEGAMTELHGPPARRPLTLHDIGGLSDVVLARKLRTLSAEPRIFNSAEGAMLMQEAARRLEGYRG